MPGPDPKPVKHGHTANTAGEWTDVEDVPFTGAPALPKLGGTKKWHQWTIDWYAQVSVMPHCKLWRKTDWIKLFDLARMKDRVYKDPAPKTSDESEIRRRENEIGSTLSGRRLLKIRYVPVKQAAEEVDLRRGGDGVAHDQADTGADPAKLPPGVPSLDERRRSIIKAS